MIFQYPSLTFCFRFNQVRLLSGMTAGLFLLPTWMQAATVEGLRCEYQKDPQGIATTKPRLSWIIQSDRRGDRQTAYQIEVNEFGTAAWNSAKVDSDRSVSVEYGGKDLSFGTSYTWRVKVWDADGKPSEWSEPAVFSTALKEWKAPWIGTNPPSGLQEFDTKGLQWIFPQGKKATTMVLEKTVELRPEQKIRRALLVLFADKTCAAKVNGAEAGQAMRWDKTASLDITKDFRPGTNSISLAVENGDAQPAAVIGRLVIQPTAGPEINIPIDATWGTAEAGKGTPWGTPALNDVPRVPAPYLRKEFVLKKGIKRATAYSTALGVYELRLNGKRVGDDVLAPGWTDFHRRVYYQTHDVTALAKEGKNALGTILGDGWYASVLGFHGRRNFYGGNPRFSAELVIEYTDGSKESIFTDSSWKTSTGPILFSDLLIGSEYDSRLAMPGWDQAGYDEKSWAPAVVGFGRKQEGTIVTDPVKNSRKDGAYRLAVSNESLGGDPVPQVVKALDVTYTLNGLKKSLIVPEGETLNLPETGVEIIQAIYGAAAETKAELPSVLPAVSGSPRIQEPLNTKKVTEPSQGVYLFDLGQNITGWARLKLQGRAGQRVTVRYGEFLNPDGTLYTSSLRGATATDYFILDGKGEQTLEPYFTFHGFRYVELRGLNTAPSPETVTGLVVHSPMERSGKFECSNPLVNQLYQNIVWGQKGNYLDIPSDCPQRDERLGWTGDAQFFIPTAAYNFDIDPFFTRWLTTLCQDSQGKDGSFAHVAPDIKTGAGATAWGDAAIICTYQVYRFYGDTRVIAANYAALEKMMEWYASKSTDFVPNIGGFGDWLALGGGASREVIDTAYYAHAAQLMSEMAGAIGNKEAETKYRNLHESIKTAFAKFFQPDGSLSNSSQTGYALAFTMDLVPGNLRAKAAEKFAGQIKRFNGHLATGFIGTPRLLPALHLAGLDDLANSVLLQETYPSWLFQVKLGATTMWERWNGWTPEKGFETVGMNSFNHYAFGSVGQYLYENIGGIGQEQGRAGELSGFKHIRIAPYTGAGFSWVEAEYDSVYGLISSSWKREGNRLVIKVRVPVNSTATVSVPVRGEENNGGSGKVTEGGKAAEQADGVRFVREENGAAVFEVGSGSYEFGSEVSEADLGSPKKE